MQVLLSISIALMAGLLMTRVLKCFHFPDVTSYLIAGLLIGPFFLGRLNISGVGFGSYEELEGLVLISNVALGFIAFSIGTEFKISYFKRVGSTPIVIAIFESLFAVLCVVAGLLLAGLNFPSL